MAKIACNISGCLAVFDQQGGGGRVHTKPGEMSLFVKHLAGRLQGLEKLHLAITR